MPDIRQWLEELGLGQYADAFDKNDIEVRAASQPKTRAATNRVRSPLRLVATFLGGGPISRLSAATRAGPDQNGGNCQTNG